MSSRISTKYSVLSSDMWCCIMTIKIRMCDRSCDCNFARRGEMRTEPGPALATWPAPFHNTGRQNTGPQIEGWITITTSRHVQIGFKCKKSEKSTYPRWIYLRKSDDLDSELMVLTPWCPSIVIISFRLSFTDTFSQVTCFWVRVKENRLKAEQQTFC